VGNQTGGAEGSRQNIGGLVGHNLSRNVSLNEKSSITYAIGESASGLYDTVTASSQTLTHNGSVSWQFLPNATSTAFVTLFGADARTTGHNENQFQLLNLQATGQLQFGSNAFGAANITVQGIRQSTPTTPAAGFSFHSSGTVSYQQLRVFNQPRLRYSALYSVNQTQFTTRLQGDLNAPREQVSQSFEQRLDYQVGRVEMRLTARIATIEGQRNALIFFMMNRQFGAY
jgi:hypothetical protein